MSLDRFQIFCPNKHSDVQLGQHTDRTFQVQMQVKMRMTCIWNTPQAFNVINKQFRKLETQIQMLSQSKSGNTVDEKQKLFEIQHKIV